MKLSDHFRFYAIRLADRAGWLTIVDPQFISQYYMERKSPQYFLSSSQRRPHSANVFKRMLDIMGSLSALIVLSPLFAVIALLIRLTSRGPVMSKSRRVGLGGRPFTLYKFRTSHSSPVVAARPPQDFVLAQYSSLDSRVTSVGKFLRRTSLDEFPQFWNVLKGDMTLVGPRPITEWQFRTLKVLVAYEHNLRPGITGILVLKHNLFTPNQLSRQTVERWQETVERWQEEQELIPRYVQLRSARVDTKILVLSTYHWLHSLLRPSLGDAETYER